MLILGNIGTIKGLYRDYLGFGVYGQWKRIWKLLEWGYIGFGVRAILGNNENKTETTMMV